MRNIVKVEKQNGELKISANPNTSREVIKTFPYEWSSFSRLSFNNDVAVLLLEQFELDSSSCSVVISHDIRYWLRSY